MKELNKLVLLLSIRFQIIQSACIISYPQDVEISPIYAKFLGKYTIYLPYNGKDIHLVEGETIQAYCRTSFTSTNMLQSQSRRYYDDINPTLNDQSSIDLSCVEGNLRYQNYFMSESVLTCNKLNWSAYDTNDVYDWCEKNENDKTFLLATKSNSDHHILAGICFNIKEWYLQTITYNVTNSGYKINKEMQRDITKTDLKAHQSLGVELSNLKTNYFDLTQLDLQQQLKDLSKTNLWLKLAIYELSSIVQGDTHKKYFNEFVKTLNIIWWRNLRLGNWNNFMNTLENYAHNNSFQVYTGTSGAVKIPPKNSVDHNILEMQDGFFNKTVPGYIWSYLTSTDNQNEDFVIVGFNSPFAEWFDINEVVFCPDICSQIPWLNKITSSFRYATAGIMFCCSTDFVRQTYILQGFPMDVLVTRASRNQTNLLPVQNSSENILNSTKAEVTEPRSTVAV